MSTYIFIDASNFLSYIPYISYKLYKNNKLKAEIRLYNYDWEYKPLLLIIIDYLSHTRAYKINIW
jgi:hypothetical protein